MALLRKHIEEYYKKLFGREERGELRLDRNFWETEGSLSEAEAATLVEPFIEKEIKNALDDMNISSAPSPDGLPVEFYKCFWEQVKSPVLEMFGKLYNGDLDLSRINYGLISLIPKLKEANNIKQCKPICLLGVDYKWFTKVLTMRLTVVSDNIINKIHTTFLPGRNILEGVVVLHETLHEMRRKKGKGIIMKLDFEKAYDKVSWPFLMEVLERNFFPLKWIELIQHAVTGGRVGINLNREPGNFFRTLKGLK
jgi:hypothetical protein